MSNVETFFYNTDDFAGIEWGWESSVRERVA